MFTSISIIAVLAFLVTLGVVGYEVVMLRKKKETTPQPQKNVEIPDYQQDPQAVQELKSVGNGGNPSTDPLTPQPAGQSQAAFAPREVPRSKMLFIIPIVIVLLVVLAGGGYYYLQTLEGEDEITDATDVSNEGPDQEGTISISPEPSLGPTIGIVVEDTSSTPTPEVTIVIESETEGDNGERNEGTNDAELSVTPGVTILPSESSTPEAGMSPTIAPDDTSDKGGIDDGLPEAGLIHQTILLGLISIFFIGLAFVL